MTNLQKHAVALGFVIAVVAAGMLDLFVFNQLLRPPSLGLDLQGGMNVILTAQERKGTKITPETMEQARFVIEQRVNALGVSEPEIGTQGGRNILVQLPGVKEPEKVLDLIGRTALLEFKEVTSSGGGTEGGFLLGETQMTGEAIRKAQVEFDTLGKPKVGLAFSKKGAKQFAEVTKRLVGKQLAIVLDGAVMSAPNVQNEITGGRAEITGDFSLDEVKELVLVLNSGRLPVHLEISENRTIGPTLGRESLEAGLTAGILGLGLVGLYLLGFYRIYGLISWLALAVFGAMLYAFLAAAQVTLTLPGIAGIILMIGVAADSSIIIFERIKEEIKEGKAMRVALESGFNLGFRTFLDADLVTFITALILFIFGIGPVKGFALTLMLGVVADILTSFLFKRSILGILASRNILTRASFLGVRSRPSEA
ncbi:MAG: protein translocase subunit SecD [Terriglobia bacterium]